MVYIWAPTLADVGSVIPTRTVNVSMPGQDDYLNTFTADTRPTNVQAQDIIDSAVNDVVLAVIAVTTALENIAKNAAKWRAAADIELAYPDRNADINTYTQLDARARYEWQLLLTAAGSQNEGVNSSLPVWYMPDPDPHGDRRDI